MNNWETVETSTPEMDLETLEQSIVNKAEKLAKFDLKMNGSFVNMPYTVTVNSTRYKVRLEKYDSESKTYHFEVYQPETRIGGFHHTKS